jgi:RecJ-like exonuclease
MANIEALLSRATEFATGLASLAHNGRRMLVVTHIDADGLSSGSIMFKALAREGAVVSVRAVPDLDRAVIEELRSEAFDFYVFTDLGSGLLKELDNSFADKYVIVDHHQLPPDEENKSSVLNAWDYGFDGGTEACSATMAYLLATALGAENRDTAHLAVIGAVGDREDTGESHSIMALNKRVLEEATSQGLVTVSSDFLLHGRETRPVHEVVAMSYSPLIPGLSGSKDLSLATLSKSGLKLKTAGRWRTLSELSGEEKQMLLDVLTSFIASAGGGTSAVGDLIGSVYTIQAEDSFTPLRDAREFASFLNACGRMDRTDLGIAICLGDREAALSEGLRVASEYRAKINKALQLVQADEERTTSHGSLVIVVGDDFLEERLTGSISSILAGSTKYRDKLVMVRAKSGDSNIKVSTRAGDAYSGRVNLGQLMREAAEEVGGVGGGHMMAAGAKFPLARLDDFTNAVLTRVSA